VNRSSNAGPRGPRGSANQDNATPLPRSAKVLDETTDGLVLDRPVSSRLAMNRSLNRAFNEQGHPAASLNGSDAGEQLVGLSGAEYLAGGGGSDSLRAGTGRDRVYGGAGVDALRGGPGRDFLQGGAGLDDCARGLDRDVEESCEA
jgi:Ca2+-binding RTX toxin-like protein